MEQPIIDTPCYHAWPLNWLFELVVCSGWQDQLFFYLVFEPTHLKNMLVKLDHFPRDRGENKKCLKPPPSFLFPKYPLSVSEWTCTTGKVARHVKYVRCSF